MSKWTYWLLLSWALVPGVESSAEAVFRDVRGYVFEVEAEVEVKVRLAAGHLEVVEGEAGRVGVRVERSIQGGGEAEAERLFARQVVRFNQTQNRVEGAVGWGRRMEWIWTRPMETRVEVSVPPGAWLRLEGRVATMVIGGFTGKVEVSNEAGSIFIGPMEGGVKASNQRGSVTVASATGDVEVKTLSGPILVGRVEGMTRVASRGGFIEIGAARGGVVAKGDGSDMLVTVQGREPRGGRLEARGGSITLNFERDASVLVEAQARIPGRLTVRGLTFTEKVMAEGRRLTGRLNEGGAVFRVKVSGGHLGLVGLEALQRIAP